MKTTEWNYDFSSLPCWSNRETDPYIYDEYFELTGRTISEMLSYRDHPFDKLPILLKNNLPIVLVAGDSDGVVPYSENGVLVEKYYTENGGNIKVFIKENKMNLR